MQHSLLRWDSFWQGTHSHHGLPFCFPSLNFSVCIFLHASCRQLYDVVLQSLTCLLPVQDPEEAGPTDEEPQHGFYLEYVLQACPAPDQNAAPLPGPHLMELVLKGASLHWPYLTRMDFVAAIAKNYSACFLRPWVAPNPPVWFQAFQLPGQEFCSTCYGRHLVIHLRACQELQQQVLKHQSSWHSERCTRLQAPGPTQWMYINVILDASGLLIPLRGHESAPMRALNRQHKERQKELQRQRDPGLLLAWQKLRQASFSLLTGNTTNPSWLIFQLGAHWYDRRQALFVRGTGRTLEREVTACCVIVPCS